MRRSFVLAVVLLVCALVGRVWGLGRLVRPLLLRVRRGELRNNKAVEIFNDTGAPVDLAAGAYNVQMFFNGIGDRRPHDQPDRHGRGRRRVRGRAGERECVDPRRRRPDERVGLVQRRRRGRPAQGHDGARRDRPDRLRPRHGVGDGARRARPTTRSAASPRSSPATRMARMRSIRPSSGTGSRPTPSTGSARTRSRAATHPSSSRARRRSPCSRAMRGRPRSPRRTQMERSRR